MSYPAQSLAKSCKLIPVMIARIIINKAKYEVREYVQVALITGGISLFMTYQSGEAGHGRAGEQGTAFMFLSLAVDGSWVGLALCLGALALDGYTVTQHAHKHNTPPSSNKQSAIAVALLLTASAHLPCVARGSL